MNVLSLKDIISIKIKSRYDGYTDQWNRIIVSKIFLITAFVIGIDYFNDVVSCLVPETAEIDMKFVQSTCWITGFYIFPELREHLKHLGYHGVPRDLNLNGIDYNKKLCTTVTKYGERDLTCAPLQKEYYLQYQWYPFFLGTLSLLYYLPYIIFFVSSQDIRNLRTYLQRDNLCENIIVKRFFNRVTNSMGSMRLRLILSSTVKILYLVVNIAAFIFIDKSLNGKFASYGLKWIHWTKLDNAMAHDLRQRGFPKPGNDILPPIGLCDVHDSSRDIRNTRMNSHKFICEISPHILYQYCLILLWFLLVATIVISFVGILLEMFACCSMFFYMKRKKGCTIYSYLTIRECQYLEEIRQKDMICNSRVLQKLTADRCPEHLSNGNNNGNIEVVTKYL